MKLFFILLFPLFLFAHELHDGSGVLQKLDIDSSFLHDKYLKKILEKQSSTNKIFFFKRTLNNAHLLIPTIKNILAKNGVPQDFLYLAMTESNFQTKAHSPKKAAGIWQFMPNTAKLYQLRMDQYIDERRDIVKSTQAAAEHLKFLHNEFGKWYLAIIAYNCGDGRLIKAIKKAHSDDLSVLIDVEKKYLPRESRNYIRRVIALALLGHDSELISQKLQRLLKISNSNSLATIELQSGERLEEIAKMIDMPYKEFKKLNRHIKYNFTPPYIQKCSVHIPHSKLLKFNKNYKVKPIKSTYFVHIVTKGETLGHIGLMYGVPYKIIMDFNKMKNTNLKINQELIIPVKKRG